MPLVAYTEANVGLEAYARRVAARAPARRTDKRCIVIEGAPGTGKTRYANALAWTLFRQRPFQVHSSEIRRVSYQDLSQPVIAKDGALWFEGYEGEEVVLFDDYRGETGFSEMLRLTHEHRSKVNVKGGSATVNPACVVFTSNEPYTLWWKGQNKEPFSERRITDHFRLSLERPSESTSAPEAVQRLANGVYVLTLKGKFEMLDDAPDENEDLLRDEEVETLIQNCPKNEGWLPAAPKRARMMRNDQELLDDLANLATSSEAQ